MESTTIARALTLLLVPLTTMACQRHVEPSGSHLGHCNVTFRPTKNAEPKLLQEESCGERFEVFKTPDGYKLSIGDCMLYLEPLAHADATEWKLASPAPCITAHGMARVTSGKLYRIADTYNFAFDGSTDDKKLTVSWGFAGTSEPK